MFAFFKSDPIKKLQKQQDEWLLKAMQSQRNGDIRSYSMLTMEAERLNEKIEQLKGVK